MALGYNIGGPNPNFKDLNDIDSTTLTQCDNTIQIYPGTYTAPLGMVATDVSFKGMGDRDAVIIEANSALVMTIGNTSSGSITFENLTIKASPCSEVTPAILLSCKKTVIKLLQKSLSIPSLSSGVGGT